MPRYTIQAPDGRTVTLEGDSPPTEADLDGIFANLPAQETERFSGWESAGRGAIEGLTLGMVDELYGAARAAFTDEDYETARDRFRAEQTAAREEDPWTFGLSEVASGFAIPGAGAAKAAGGAAKALPRALRGAKIGAGYGAAAGAGYSEGETVGEVAGDVVRGTALGGAVGAALPGAARAAQRFRNRYSGQNRAAREVQDMLRMEGISSEDAAAILKKNSDLMVGDLTEEGRQRLAGLARERPDLYDRLTARNRTVGSRMVDQSIGEFDEIFPEPPAGMYRDAFLAAPDDVEQNLTKLLGGINRETAEVIPGKYYARLTAIDPAIYKRAERAAVGRGERMVRNPRSKRGRDQNKMYLGEYFQAIMHDLSELSKRGGSRGYAAGKLRSDIMSDVDKFNPAFAEASKQYGLKMSARDAARPAYERTVDRIRNNPDKFLRDLEQADSSSKLVKDLETILPSGETRDTFLAAQQVLRLMSRTRADLVRESNVNPTVMREVDARLTAIRRDMGNLMRSLGASQFGGEHGLMIGSAVRRLYGSVIDAIPFARVVTGRSSKEPQLAQMLMGRNVPLPSTVPQRPLSRTMATITGAAGIEQGRE